MRGGVDKFQDAMEEEQEELTYRDRATAEVEMVENLNTARIIYQKTCLRRRKKRILT